ncbi:methionine adenosyltransferase [Anseongella ginsenosidimutans]|uniref:S-adenosylmethionine synthase n=1 Tax=Anseongella ginsenosidimutans TaxID=496056 RepID=A0A4R3KYF9_9SPHI|nr:methionine adenosyltransferase [Anseongella ginsenosidimutans]QEC51681.1 methionine adenosyltransferase [Anseongella ginsenosidimutans]TCS89032.1 methionine adenosyltransferase [Anseongella ginsenosidimutans]
MPYLFTSESVSEGHPDKVADQISDAILDEFLTEDPESKVACETLVTTGLVMLAGEIKSGAYVDVQAVARKVIERIGYTRSEYMFDANSCAVISALHEQSPDINQGVERSKPEEQGAGDQGMMFGYATNETDNYMPLALSLSHLLLQELAAIRKEGKKMKYLRPDAKSQVTIEYSDKHKPVRIDTIVLSTQHDDFPGALEKIESDIKTVLLPRVKKLLSRRMQRLFTADIKFHVNPTGKFVIGGPHGDSGLTGRKIIVDTYGGKGAHGGGAFSGKDASKVDRSAAYATRYLAKNLVAAGVADQALVQVAYAIGVAEPVGLYVTTYGTTKVNGDDGKKLSDGEIARRLKKLFDLRPYNIVNHFGLKNPIFSGTAAYGHMGRNPGIREINGKKYETFTWEKLDLVDKIREAFDLQ